MIPIPNRARLAAALQTREGVLARRLLLVLGVYLAIRLVFLVAHFAQFRGLTLRALLGAFGQGLRFDLAAIVYSNAAFILLSFAPAALYARRAWQRLLFGVFFAVNGALTLVMMGDVAYYPFTGTRVTAEVFAFSREARAQAGHLLLDYAPLTAVAGGLLAALAFLYPRQRGGPVLRRGAARTVLTLVALLALGILAARGGVQKKPLKPIHAFASGQHELGVLALNGSFTLLHSLTERQLEPVRYFASDAEAESIVRAPYGLAARPEGGPEARPQNVVLLILESFGTEYWGGESREYRLTPFLDSLAREGAFFTNNFANGHRSMDALPSMLLGVPLYMGQSLAVSAYQANEWLGLGHFLERAGYHTSMFHGAPKGTMYFDAIASMAGIRDFYPMERYPEQLRERDFDAHWGVFDEPWLQFTARELGRHRQPFFTTIFTISTHQPYRVPPEYEQVLPSGSRPIHRSVAYVDLAVRRFFETARTQPWYDSTLFVITGDHTPPLRSPRYDTPLGRFMVPLLLFHPGRPLPPLDTARITQHADIFATVLDYSGIRPVRVPALGRSVFSEAPGEAVLASAGGFRLVRREGVLERLPTGEGRLYAYRREATGAAEGDVLAEGVAGELSRRLMAHLQYYSAALINNSFYREAGGCPGRAPADAIRDASECLPSATRRVTRRPGGSGG